MRYPLFLLQETWKRLLKYLRFCAVMDGAGARRLPNGIH